MAKKTELSIIIPVCDLVPEAVESRIKALNLALKNFYINVEVIIVEQVLSEKTCFLNRLNGGKKIRIEYPVFNKPWCINVGVKNASFDHIVIADCDMYSTNAYWPKLLDWMKINDFNWGFAWNRLVYTDRKQADVVLSNGCFPGLRYETPRRGYSEGGLVCFNKSFFYSIGCCNEMFQELGGPDNEIILRARSVEPSYAMFPALVYHIHHKQRKKSSRPTRGRNRELLRVTGRDPMKIINWLKSQNMGSDNPLVARKELFK